jgi:predicted nuclease of predicted toxin-antitoxin system
MRWLLDQGLPRSSAALLNEASQDAIHVGDVGMAGATDPSILLHALHEDRVVVTLDADFHSLLALNGSSRPSVIRIREEGLKGEALAKVILCIARQFEKELEGGCVMSYQGGKIRYSKLPLS